MTIASRFQPWTVNAETLVVQHFSALTDIDRSIQDQIEGLLVRVQSGELSGGEQILGAAACEAARRRLRPAHHQVISWARRCRICLRMTRHSPRGAGRSTARSVQIAATLPHESRRETCSYRRTDQQHGEEAAMAIRDVMSESVRPFLRDGEQLQGVVGAQTASAYVAGIAGFLPFLGLNRYRIIAITSERILVLDAGKMSMKKARSVVMELPRSTSLGQPSGVWHVIPMPGGKLRVPRRFFKDVEQAGAAGVS
jgi:hypothetical protein